MKDIIVVCYATHRAGLMDEYEQQLKDADIPLHIEPVSLPDGINSVTARWKFEYMRRMCSKFADYDRIVFTDAWDVLFYGSKNYLMAMDDFPMVGGERNCWPDPKLAPHIMSSQTPASPWRFCNAGVISGMTASLGLVCNRALSMSGLDRLEQDWFNNLFAFEDDIGIDCDELTEVSYTVSYDKEDGSLTYFDSPFNKKYGTYPQFLHFSGKCPTEPFRAMLRGEVDALR